MAGNKERGDRMEDAVVVNLDKLSFHHTLSPVPDPGVFFMHAHERYEVLVFLSGDGSFFVEGNEYPLQSGSVMLMRAGEGHCLHIRSSAPYERIGIHFDPDLFASIDPAGDLLKPFLRRKLGSGNRFFLPNLTPCLQPVLALERDTPARAAYYTILGFLLSILAQASTVFPEGQEDQAMNADLGKHYDIIEYVNQNLDQDLSLEGIAGHFYLSKSQLSRLFKRMTGSTLWDYVLIKRLLLARTLIRSGESVSAACTRAGFREYSSFYRAYRKRFGTSPNQDRTLFGKV